nr:hypothetical protein [Tanacetum cinerariifolium]
MGFRSSWDMVTADDKDRSSKKLIGLLLQGINRLEYDFKSFDNRISSKISTVFSCGYLEILQSCNGLLLCNMYLDRHCVYNPTNNQVKMIPTKSPRSGTRMAFDPTKSPHYKVIQYVFPSGSDYSFQLHIYSSETRSWSVCSDRFPIISFKGFNEGVYWNDSIHWHNRVFKMTSLRVKLDIEYEEPVLTELELPTTCDGKSNFQSKLFESRGCFLLLENGTTTGVVSRSIFSCRSLAPENGTTVPYTELQLATSYFRVVPQ